MGVDVHFTIRGLCKALQWPSDGRAVDRLRRKLHRLTEGTVELWSGRSSFTGHLIDFIAREDETPRFYLQLSPKIAKLFDADSYTNPHAHRRLSLHSFLAKWFDGYLASEREPRSVRLSAGSYGSDFTFKWWADNGGPIPRYLTSLALQNCRSFSRRGTPTFKLASRMQRAESVGMPQGGF